MPPAETEPSGLLRALVIRSQTVRTLVRSALKHAVGYGDLAGIRQLCAVLPHAITNTAATWLNGPAKRFHVIAAGAFEKAWRGDGEIGKKQNDSSCKSVSKDHRHASRGSDTTLAFAA